MKNLAKNQFGLRLRERRSLFGLILLCFLSCILAFSIALGLSAYYPAAAWEWQPLDSYAFWDPSEDAARIADELLAAQTIPETEELIYEVLEILGIQVHDRVGNIILGGNQDFSDEFYLYDFQIFLLAQAFQEERYIPLNNVIQLWRDLGLTVQEQTGLTARIDPEIIENSLRSLRLWTEENPEDPGGFIIRLIDNLGDREEHPFSLLEEPEDEEPEGPAALTPEEKSAPREEFEELLEYEKELQPTEEEMDAFLEGAMTGDIGAMISAFLDEEELEMIESKTSRAATQLEESLVDASIPRAERDLLESTAELLGSFGTALSVDDPEDLQHLEDLTARSLEQMKAQQEALESRKQQQLDQAREELSEMAAARADEDLQGDALDEAARVRETLRILDNIEEVDLTLAETSARIDSFQRHLEWVEEETRNREYMPDPPLRAAVEEDEPRSSLILDPLQSLLLQLDLLVMTRDTAAEGFHTSFSLPSFPAAAVMARDSSSRNILGTLGEGLRRAFDKSLWRYLGAADRTAGRLKKKIDLPGKILNVLHGTLIMLAHKTEIEVNYLPEADAELGQAAQPPEGEPIPGIRLRDRSEERFGKRIQLQVTITFDPPDAATRVEFGRLAALNFIESSGPMLRAMTGAFPSLSPTLLANRLAELEFPEPGPQPDTPVKITYDRLGLMRIVDTGKSLQHYVEFKDDEWHNWGDGIALTDEDGVAEVNFYLIRDGDRAVEAGGEPEWVKEEGFTIRAHPLTQLPDEVLLDWGDLAFAVADQLQGLFPGMGAADISVYIERLKPTPWEGNITFTRDIKASYSTTSNPRGPTAEDRQRGSYNTSWEAVEHSWSSNWKYTLEMDVLLSPEGELIAQKGDPEYSFEFEVEQNEYTRSVSWHKCEHQEVKLEREEEYTATPVEKERMIIEGATYYRDVGSESPRGEPEVTLEIPAVTHWTGQYRVLVITPFPPLVLHGYAETTEERCRECHPDLSQSARQSAADEGTAPMRGSEKIEIGPREEIISRIVLARKRYPDSTNPDWYDFNPEDQKLEGDISWDEELELKGSELRDVELSGLDLDITTTLEWNLERVVEK